MYLAVARSKDAAILARHCPFDRPVESSCESTLAVRDAHCAFVGFGVIHVEGRVAGDEQPRVVTRCPMSRGCCPSRVPLQEVLSSEAWEGFVSSGRSRLELVKGTDRFFLHIDADERVYVWVNGGRFGTNACGKCLAIACVRAAC